MIRMPTVRSRSPMSRFGPRPVDYVDDPALLAELEAAVRAKQAADAEARRLIVEADDAIVEVIDRCLASGMTWAPIAKRVGGAPNNVASRYRRLVDALRASRERTPRRRRA